MKPIAVTARFKVLFPERTWAFAAETDTSEMEHLVVLAHGRLTCSCRGFVEHGCCKHVGDVKEKTMSEETTALVERPQTELTAYMGDNPATLYQRLELMKAQVGLIHNFLQQVMIQGQDYATLSDLAGTDRKKDEKAVLLKPGAEKLCELYGYAPTLVSLTEVPEYESGHYRVSVVVGLVRKGDGVKVAEGVGECSTRESKYAYRWIGERYALEAVGGNRALLDTFKRRERGSRENTYFQYRVPNEDLHDVWNTILKMAKKRAFVDATLTATAASGVFGQAAQELDEWIEGEYSEVPGPAQSQADVVPSGAPGAARQQAQPQRPQGSVPPRQQQQARHPHPAASQPAPTAPREPTSASDWLNAIGEKLGTPAKLEAIAVMQRVFGTAVVTHLQGDELKLYIRMLQVRHAQTEHDHVADAAVSKEGEFFCAACGEGVDPRSIPELSDEVEGDELEGEEEPEEE